MSQVPSSRDRLARLPFQPLATEKQQTTANAANKRAAADPAPGVTRRADRVDVSATASRAGAELAQRLQSVRDALRDAAQNAEPAPGIKDAQAELDVASNDLREVLGNIRPAGTDGPWFRTRAGGVFLNAQNDNIDLEGVPRKLHLDVNGQLGSRELLFASGTTLSSIAAAINSFTGQTGVRAEYRAGKGVEFRRADSTGFTSIHVIDDGGLINGGFSVVP
jgi:hypothetical protein